MALAFTHAPAEQLQAAVQINESKRTARGLAQVVAVDFLERRAGYNDPTARVPLLQLCTDQIEPGPAVVVRQGNAFGHFLDIGFGVQLVAFNEGNAQLVCQRFRDRGLARPAHSHHDDCLRHANL